MLTEIDTKFEEIGEPYDEGVERAYKSTEDFTFRGEQITRITEVRLLDDGGVNLVQRVEEQQIYENITLNAAVADKLRSELEDGS